MYWNYRVVKHSDGEFGVYEVYYDQKTNKPFLRTTNAVVYGDDIEDIKIQLQMIVNDVNKEDILLDSEIKKDNNV